MSDIVKLERTAKSANVQSRSLEFYSIYTYLFQIESSKGCRNMNLKIAKPFKRKL
jgi:hypothetical protein